MPLSEHKNALFLLFRFCRALRGGKRGAKTACFFASPSRPKILPVANEFFLLSSGFPGLLCPDIGTCLRGQRMTERNILRNFAESWKIFRQRPLQTG